MKDNGERENTENSNSSPNPDRDKFRELLSYIEKTDLEFVQMEKEGKKFSFHRSAPVMTTHNAPPASEPQKAEEEPPQFLSVRSPIVGRFYRSMGPDRPPLVVEGSRVNAGQRVAIVEAMKIKKEVFSGVTGKVLKILVRDGDSVEYGQELYTVEPLQEENGG